LKDIYISISIFWRMGFHAGLFVGKPERKRLLGVFIRRHANNAEIYPTGTIR